jgi:plasmid stabilization system protein ParE
VAEVVVSPAAADDLARLIRTHTLSGDTRERVRRVLRPLATFPRLGAALDGRWQGYRFVLGPWRWLVVVYVFDEELDRVVVVAMVDARSSGWAIAR